MEVVQHDESKEDRDRHELEAYLQGSFKVAKEGPKGHMQRV